ncbi:MAG TPA: ribosome silencing factor [Bacillales bacterium]|nr:ribosome silencing factor [Bacillales bacterium]
MTEEELALLTAKAADDKKADKIVVLNMEGISLITDYFMICHGNSEKQVQAIARAIKEVAEDRDIPIKRMEGYDSGRWVLVDLGSVITHIFHREEREHYQLEKLWGDAPTLNLEEKMI